MSTLNPYKVKIKLYGMLSNILGDSIVERITLNYYSKYVSNTGILFIHIPKNGGTSICRTLYGRRIGHFTYSEWEKYHMRITKSVSSFTIVRHPISRLQSAYRFLMYGSNMGAVLNQDLYRKDIRFRSFDAFVNEWLCDQDMRKVNGIFRPQYLYVSKDNNILVNRVFKIEESFEIESYLSSKLNHRISLNHHNKSRKVEDFISSTSTQAVIQKLYRSDFELFNYS